MRVSFLLASLVAWPPALAPAVAHADAATPDSARAATRLAVGDRSVTVSWGDHDRKIYVRVAGGGELVLEPAGRAYVSEDLLAFRAELAGSVAPVPLVKVTSRPEACSDFWEIYVSVVDGVPRPALALYGVADPPAMQSSTVKFTRDGGAVVTTRTSEDEKIVRTRRTRYRFDGRVYVDVSKRAGTRSK